MLDEIFGEENFVSQIVFAKNSGATDQFLSSPYDYVLWYVKKSESAKFRRLYYRKIAGSEFAERYNGIQIDVGVRRCGYFRALTPERSPEGILPNHDLVNLRERSYESLM